MPDSPAQVVEHFYEITDRGMAVDDWLDAVVGLAHPDVEYVNPPDAIEPGTRRGLEGFRAAFGSVREGFQVVQIEAEKTVARDDRVAVRIKVHIRAPGSGIELGSQSWSHLWTVRDGLVVRFEWFRDPDEALTRLDSV